MKIFFIPVDETNNEEYENMHEIVPDYNLPNNSNQQSTMLRINRSNDFSFHIRQELESNDPLTHMEVLVI